MENYRDYLNQSQAARKEARTYLDEIPQQRQSGVQDIKTRENYAERRQAVDDATKTLYETQRRLDALPENLQRRTSDRNITQSQLDRLIGAESQPLSQQYKSAGLGREQASQSLSLVDKAIDDYVNQYNQDAQMKYRGMLDSSDNYFNLYRTGSAEEDARFSRERQLAAEALARQQAEFDKNYKQQQLGIQQRQLEYQMENARRQEDRAQQEQIKGQTSAYIQDMQDTATQMAIERTTRRDDQGNVIGGGIQSPEFERQYQEILKNLLYENDPLYADMGLDMDTIYQTRGNLDRALANY